VDANDAVTLLTAVFGHLERKLDHDEFSFRFGKLSAPRSCVLRRSKLLILAFLDAFTAEG
jgi:hypothetical protein